MSGAGVLDADFSVTRRTFEVGLAIRAARGERLALFGPSGAGKSTCLEALAGTTRLTRGFVSVDGTLVNAARPGRDQRVAEPRHRSVSFVRQPTTLFPHLSARANVAYGLARAAAAERIEVLLDLVELEDGRDAKPDDLSGGQRQRVALARALARPFALLLLDEPFSAVDASSRARLRDVAAGAPAQVGAVAVLVTHDLGEAQAFGDRLGIVHGGEVLQIGPPDAVVGQPSTATVAELVGYGAFLPRDDTTAFALHPDRFESGAHPDRGVVVTGRVRAVRAFGPRWACELELEARALEVRGRGNMGTVTAHLREPPAPGDTVELTALRPPVVRLGERARLAGHGRR